MDLLQAQLILLRLVVRRLLGALFLDLLLQRDKLTLELLNLALQLIVEQLAMVLQLESLLLDDVRQLGVELVRLLNRSDLLLRRLAELRLGQVL